MRFLIVEDDENLAKMIRMSLDGIASVQIALTGENAVEMFDSTHYDLVILDLMLPGIGGEQVLRRIRTRSTVPVIILSAVSEIDKKIECLNGGADDYLEKPFSRDELVARINAALRRENNNFSGSTYTFGNLTLQFANKMVTIDGNFIEMNNKSYEVFELLVREKERIVSKQQIFDRVWGYYSETLVNVVDTSIFKIRKCLTDYGLQDHLKTVKARGYMWTERIQ